MKIASWPIILLLLTTVIGGCMPLGPFRVKEAGHPSSDVHFVEFDEFGNAFNRKQLDAAVAAARQTAEDHGNVLVYIHGWHHSARDGDGDVANFQDMVTRISKAPNAGKTVGIYVGWRGDSIDSDTPLIGWSSYLLTFWDRKSTAHNIGNGGGVSELLRKLSYIRQSSRDSRLLIMGHSFGGAILYSSVSQTLGDQIRRDAGLAGNSSLPSVADLTLLVNPAFEAMRIKPLFDQARTYEYPDGARPSLVVVTTDADWATGITFPLGRLVGTLFQAYPDGYHRKLDKTAVGHYKPYLTHQLVTSGCTPESLGALSRVTDEKSSPNLCLPNPGSKTAPAMMLTRCDQQKQCQEIMRDDFLERGPVSEGKIPYRFPIVNIRTNEAIMEGHSDIWNENMENFIYQLMLAIIDGSIPFHAPVTQ